MTDAPPPLPPLRRLTRSIDDRMLAGVCGGIADYTRVDPTVIRVAFGVFALFAGSGVVAYALAWLLIPGQREAESHAESWLRRFRRNR